MADFPDICASDYSFTLLYNTQSYTSPLTNSTQTASLTGDQWRGTATYTNKYGTDARTLRAFIMGLKGQVGRFNYTPPDLNQGGTLLGTPVIDGAGQLGDSINTNGWDYPQENLILAGDYLTVNSELKMVLADVSAYSIVSYPDATNLMPSPFDPSGWFGATTDPDGTIVNVTEQNPSGSSVVGLAEQTGVGTFLLNTSLNSQVPLVRGGRVHFSIQARKIGAGDNFFRLALNSTSGEEFFANIGYSGVILTNATNAKSKITQLSDSYVLIEFSAESLGDEAAVYGNNFFWSDSGVPVVGSQVNVQASFFGENPLEYPYALYNEFEDAAEASEWTPSDVTITSSSGLLSFVATGADPQMATMRNLDGSKYTHIIVKWRRNSGLFGNQFFWGNSNGGPSSDRRISFDEGTQDTEVTVTGPDLDGFYTSIIDLTNFNEWNGVSGGGITEVRFDFGSNDSSDFDIDHIKIYSPSLLKAYEEYWPALVDGTATLQIAPPLRKSPADGSPIEVEKPYMIAKLEDDEQTSFQVSGPVIYNATFAINEVF